MPHTATIIPSPPKKQPKYFQTLSNIGDDASQTENSRSLNQACGCRSAACHSLRGFGHAPSLHHDFSGVWPAGGRRLWNRTLESDSGLCTLESDSEDSGVGLGLRSTPSQLRLHKMSALGSRQICQLWAPGSRAKAQDPGAGSILACRISVYTKKCVHLCVNTRTAWTK